MILCLKVYGNRIVRPKFGCQILTKVEFSTITECVKNQSGIR